MKTISLSREQHLKIQSMTKPAGCGPRKSPKGIEIIECPPSSPVDTPGIEYFRSILKPYQRDLCDWMKSRSSPTDGYPPGGALLLTPGLGKTLTTLYHLFATVVKKRPEGTGPVVLVMARNCREIWISEIKRIANWMNMHLRIGSLNGCEMDVDAVDFLITTPNRLGRMEQAMREKKPREKGAMDETAFFSKTFTDVVIDEADMLRNGDETMWWSGVAALKRKCTWALTGTPVHKSEGDFYSLLVLLGVSRETAEKRFAEVRSVMTRRMTQQHLEGIDPSLRLPPCTVHKHILKFATEEEADAYGMMFKRTREIAMTDVMNNAPGHQRQRSVITFGAHLTTLRRGCVVPDLARNIQAPDPAVLQEACAARPFVLNQMNAQRLLADLGKKRPRDCGDGSGAARKRVQSSNLPISDGVLGERCTKIQAVLEFVRAECAERPVLVFSNWTQPILLLESLLKRAGVGGVETYHGGMTNVEQEDTIRRIRGGGVRVLLATIASAKSSLNLTEFKTVVFTDTSLDPQEMIQAVHRVHRHGQTSPVSIHYFLIEGTVEIRVFEIAQSHDQLAKDIVDGGLIPRSKIVISSERFLSEFAPPSEEVTHQWRSSAIRATAAASTSTLQVGGTGSNPIPLTLKNWLSNISSAAAPAVPPAGNSTSNGQLLWEVAYNASQATEKVSVHDLFRVYKIGEDLETIKPNYLVFKEGSNNPSMTVAWRAVSSPIPCFDSMAVFKKMVVDRSGGRIAPFIPYRGLFELMANSLPMSPFTWAILFRDDKLLLLFKKPQICT